MKKIVCELCEGTEFAKEEGVFVCQNCGTRYTVEEAKALMREVEGAPAAAGGGSPAVNAGNQQLENLLILAANAFESGNNQEAELYCNKVIEMDVSCYKAWMLKGKAIGWQSTYGAPKMEEGAIAMMKAVTFAPEEEKENVATEAMDTIERICLALISLAKKNFSTSPTSQNYSKFLEFFDYYNKTVKPFEKISERTHAYVLSRMYTVVTTTCRDMNNAAVAALEFIREKWNALEHPNDESLSTYIDWCADVNNVLKFAITLGETVKEDPEALIVRYKNRIVAIEEPIGKYSEEQKWSSFYSKMVWEKSQCLTDEAKQLRRKEIAECKEKIALLEKQKEEAERKARIEKAEAAEREKQEKIAAYWDAHKEEKEKLEAEMQDLKKKNEALDAEISDLEQAIKAAENELQTPTPFEQEAKTLRQQITELNTKKNSLGIFAGKEKKKISEDIALLENKLSEVEGKAKEERETKEAEIQKKTSLLREKLNGLNQTAGANKGRIAAIQTEFTKERS